MDLILFWNLPQIVMEAKRFNCVLSPRAQRLKSQELQCLWSGKDNVSSDKKSWFFFLLLFCSFQVLNRLDDFLAHWQGPFSSLSVLVKTLISLGNNALPLIWATLNQVNVTHKINHRIEQLCIWIEVCLFFWETPNGIGRSGSHSVMSKNVISKQKTENGKSDDCFANLIAKFERFLSCHDCGNLLYSNGKLIHYFFWGVLDKPQLNYSSPERQDNAL